MSDKKITQLQLRSNVNDDCNFVTDDGIQTYRVTAPQIKNYLKSAPVPPTLQKFLTGSGTYNKNYTFLVSTANATAGATYTNNGNTFTIQNTIASGDRLVASSDGPPTLSGSGVLTKTGGTGDATIPFILAKAPVYLRVRMAGGGGGGATAATTANGADGDDTTFGTSFLLAEGGEGGIANGGASLGSGGDASITGSGAYGAVYKGGHGGRGGFGQYFHGGMGGQSLFPGAGAQTIGDAAMESFTVPNTGCGGSGGAGYTGGPQAGNGGGGGGWLDVIVPEPADTYDYEVGDGGAGGTGTTYNGGDGASGVIIVEEFYQ